MCVCVCVCVCAAVGVGCNYRCNHCCRQTLKQYLFPSQKIQPLLQVNTKNVSEIAQTTVNPPCNRKCQCIARLSVRDFPFIKLMQTNQLPLWQGAFPCHCKKKMCKHKKQFLASLSSTTHPSFCLPQKQSTAAKHEA